MRARPATTIAAGLVALLLFAGFAALGVWQVHRRTAKLDLIAHIQARMHATPVAPPGPAAWGSVTAARDAYRRVVLHGIFRHDRATLVRAATRLGSGYWVLTPLATDRGFAVLVNRGFVSPEQRTAYDRPRGRVAVTGYLRISEPGGGFLRANDPTADRWYSRDVAGIAAARRLSRTAPYFVDADQSGDAPPVGGLTVVAFPNNHLAYMLTWFALAAMTLAGFALFVRHDRRRAT